MKALIPMAILLLLTGCAKQTKHNLTVAIVSPDMPVTIDDCHGRLVAIYADSEAKIPAANPVEPASIIMKKSLWISSGTYCFHN